MNKEQKLTMVLASAAAALSYNLSNARDAVRGTFTLPCSTYWGSTLLPAGDYSFALRSTTFPATMAVRNGKKVCMIPLRPGVMRSTADENVLIIERSGDRAVARSMYLADLRTSYDIGPSATANDLPAQIQPRAFLQRAHLSTSISTSLSTGNLTSGNCSPTRVESAHAKIDSARYVVPGSRFPVGSSDRYSLWTLD